MAHQCEWSTHMPSTSGAVETFLHSNCAVANHNSPACACIVPQETCKHLATKQEDEHQVGLHMTTSFTQSHCLYPAATSGPGLCPGSVLQLFWGDTVPQHLKASHSQPWRPGVEFSGMCSVTGPIYPSY